MQKLQALSILGVWFLVLFFSTAGANWVQTNGPGGGAQINALAVHDNTIFAGTSGSGIFRSTNNGASWIASDSGITDTYVWCLTVLDSAIFAGTDQGGVFLSNNDGISWKACDSDVDECVWCLATNGSDLFAGYHGGGVSLSTNSGTSWSVVDSGLMAGGVLSLVASDSVMYAGSDRGGIYRSVNNGTSWKEADSGILGVDTTMVLSMAISGNTILAGCSSMAFSGIYRSTNNGDSWTRVSGFPGQEVSSFVVKDSAIFAGTTGGGVFLSTDNGSTWKTVNSGLSDSLLWSLTVCGNNLFAGTQSGRVWRRPLSEIVGVINHEFQQSLIKQLSFQAHSPSFTNPNLTIEFSLPHSDQVTVKIYNLSGREITSLVNRYLGAGSYNYTWDTKNVATGCYVVRMQTGSNTFVKSVPVSR